eukprot:1138580-Prorocentrum_lima.AAC.1
MKVGNSPRQIPSHPPWHPKGGCWSGPNRLTAKERQARAKANFMGSPTAKRALKGEIKGTNLEDA